MPRQFATHGLPRGSALAGAADPHVSDTSTGTADVKVITPPPNATACMIVAETTAARVTFDGSTPAAANGLPIPVGASPLYVPLGTAIKFVSQAAANSILHVLWLE